MVSLLFEEYARLVDKVSEDNLLHILHFSDINYSIHFHVWTDTAFFATTFIL